MREMKKIKFRKKRCIEYEALRFLKVVLARNKDTTGTKGSGGEKNNEEK